MNQFTSFITKETKHILRDRRTMLILFGIPVVMMLLFGFAISTDIKDVKLVVVTSSMDHVTQQVVQQLDASEYFTVVKTVTTPEEARQLLADNKVNLAIVFSRSFADKRMQGKAAIQFIGDYTDPNTTEQQINYAKQIILKAMQPSGEASQQANINVKLLYNPQMKSAYLFVPGIMGMLMLLICAMMTSVSIVREKEKGSMEVLLVSPMKPLYIMLAKAVPYMVLSIIILCSVLLISKYILNVPLTGSLFVIFGMSFLYILLSLCLGLLISVVAQTQVAALLMSGMMLLLPSILLSGMIYPVESMPVILQYISALIPARWYISAIRKLMVMGVGFDMVKHELAVLALMTTLLMTIALRKFNIRLS